MTALTINLPKKLESQLIYLETISQRSKDFHIKETLIRYFRGCRRFTNALKRLEKKGKTYTSEEVGEKLNLK